MNESERDRSAEEPEPPSTQSDTLDAVHRKARRMERARRSKRSFYRELVQVGALGWIFILPVVGFVLLGHWLQRRYGWAGATLIGMVLGIAIGGSLVARRVRQTLREDEEENR